MNAKPDGLNRWTWKCPDCEHPVTAMTVQEMDRAMMEHCDHVNRTADRAIDPHFADRRIDYLIAI